MVFRDRTEAGRALAAELAPLISPPCVVAAIPRGGVAVALPIVERLKLPLTVVYARKLTVPFAPEFAFGALDEDGQVTLEADSAAMLGLGRDDIEKSKVRVEAEIRRRMARYGAPPLARYLPHSAVVLVDDGLATGLTMRAALAYARRHGVREVTVAVPCAATEAALTFRREADRFVALAVDEAFVAVGAYYEDFSPVSDDEVVAMLGRAGAFPPPADPGVSALRVVFRNSRGQALAGVLLLPSGAGPHPVVVVCHGFGSSKDSPRNRTVADALRAARFAVFLFDFTGHGESEGALEESTLAQQVDDLGAALDILETLDEVDADRTGAVGASSGAAVALVRAAADPRIRALALRSPNPTGAGDAASRVTVPTLLVVGERDAPIRALNEDLLPQLGGPKRLEVVRRGNHLFENPEALREAARLTVAWLSDSLGR